MGNSLQLRKSSQSHLHVLVKNRTKCLTSANHVQTFWTMFNCLYHVSFMSNHVKQYQATSYYHVWPWCFIPIAPPASEHCVEANTKRPCILPACHCVDTSYSHTFQDHNDITTWCNIYIYVSIVCPPGLQVVPPHRLGRLDRFDGHTEIVVAPCFLSCPTLVLHFRRLTLQRWKLRSWILVTTDVGHGSHGSHLDHI